jgi:hypothetical protein
MGSSIPRIRELERARANGMRTSSQQEKWIKDELQRTFPAQSIAAQTLLLGLAKCYHRMAILADSGAPVELRSNRKKPQNGALSSGLASLTAEEQSGSGPRGKRDTSEEWAKSVAEFASLAKHAKLLRSELADLIAEEAPPRPGEPQQGGPET